MIAVTMMSVSIIDITDDKLPKSLKRMNRTKLVRSEVSNLIATTLTTCARDNHESPIKLSSIINAVHIKESWISVWEENILPNAFSKIQ